MFPIYVTLDSARQSHYQFVFIAWTLRKLEIQLLRFDKNPMPSIYLSFAKTRHKQPVQTNSHSQITLLEEP